MAPNLPSPHRPPGAGTGPGVRAHGALGEALSTVVPCTRVFLCGTQRSTALLAPHQVSPGRRKDTALPNMGP